MYLECNGFIYGTLDINNILNVFGWKFKFQWLKYFQQKNPPKLFYNNADKSIVN